MSGIGGVSGAAPSTLLAVNAAQKAKPAQVMKPMDSDGDNDGSRPGQVEAGKGGSIDRLA